MIIINSIFVAVIIVVTHTDVMLKHLQAYNCFITEGGPPVRHKLFGKNLESLTRIHTIVVTRAINAHHLLF